MRLRTQVLLLQLAVIAVSLAVGFGLVIAGADDRVRDEYAQRALAIAQSVAADAEVRSEVAAHPGDRVDAADLVDGPLQLQAAAVRARTGALFVVIGNDRGIRLAHPEVAELARTVSTDPSKVLSGSNEVNTDRGTLGESVRAKVPVLNADGVVIGFVSVGVSTERLASETRTDIVAIALLALAALGIGAVGSVLLARRWRRLTLGLEPDELAELVREQGAVLHSMADGVLAVDADGIVRVVNDRARALLDIDAPVGTPADDLGLTPRVATVLATPTDEPLAAGVGERVVLVSSHRVRADGRDLGMVLSVIDRTDVEALSREVDSIKSMSTALRAQRHETANRMHVLAGLLRHGHADEALAYLDEVTGTGPGGALLAGLDNVREPHLHAFLDAKAAQARERRVVLRLGDQTWIQGVLTEPVVVTTVLGNLVDNGIDAAASGPDGGQPGEVEVEVIADGDTVLVTIGDSGPGIAFDDPDDVFAEGATTKPGAHVPGGRGMGLALARQIARRVGGDVWVADAGGRGSADDDEPGGAVFVARLPGVLAPTDEAEDHSYSQTDEPGVTP
ncbi:MULTISPECIES: sensor histidine kinase [unclassified Gordonia (in: high G+C Gram-positive bacteria)]|uniref:sensor histidine kinase n=1 Tax=unclassified Gordonia (in: high G+C Gram-positive bacteria) TaxID=2657482 RepID=UPI001964422A|nr:MULTISPECIES: sensor histidine kinase [unclassified Gordonia (in: high G+C Gram-positive bacteria)]MBN0973265.1 sensor histidine kinase [Gordonia sp. BP-119]MBN0983298.1 sensor histidine kinase [Gordonia sp. BP-94]